MTPSLVWVPQRTPPELAPGALHVWAVSLDPSAADVPAHHATLASDEHHRAARFHFEHDRSRYVVGRSVLRQLLAAYLRTDDPRQVELDYGSHGKPMLSAALASSRLRFNVSHSAALALVAFTRDVEIGVDVERIHDITDLEALMRSCFAVAERDEITRMTQAEERLQAFFRCWTRKEAILKALGWGLAKELDSFEVTTGLDRPRLCSMDGETRAAGSWRLIHLVPAPEFVGAAAWQGPELSLSCFSFAH